LFKICFILFRYVPKIGFEEWKEAIKDGNTTLQHVQYMELKQPISRMVKNGYEKTCEGFWKEYIEE